MEAAFSVFLATFSAILMHCSVRYAAGPRRRALIAAGLATIGVAFYFGTALGGFWPGIYTLVSVFFLATVVTPWLDLYWRKRRVE